MRRERRRQVPPDDGYEWLNPDQAGRRMGVTSQAVTSRVRRGTIPHVRRGRRIWIRADHLLIWQRSRQVTAAGYLLASPWVP